MRKRVSKIQSWMNQAEGRANDRSHDKDTQVGCVITTPDYNVEIMTGYNGFVEDAPDDILPINRPDKYEFMQHAERNAINLAAKHGRALEGSVAICTMSPCAECTRALYTAGVRKVIFKEKYRTFEEVLKMKDIYVVEKGTTEEGFFVVEYLGGSKRP